MIAFTLLSSLLLTSPSPTVDTVTVVVVRHAEKASETERDPSLSPAGISRAHALDSALANSNVVAVVVTPYQRTAQTAAAVARRFGLEPTVVPVAGGVAAHARAVAAAATGKSGTVLVVGHSNTVGAIVAALGGPAVGDLCDADYQSIFVVTSPGTGASTIRSRFGASSSLEGCELSDGGG